MPDTSFEPDGTHLDQPYWISELGDGGYLSFVAHPERGHAVSPGRSETAEEAISKAKGLIERFHAESKGQEDDDQILLGGVKPLKEWMEEVDQAKEKSTRPLYAFEVQYQGDHDPHLVVGDTVHMPGASSMFSIGPGLFMISRGGDPVFTAPRDAVLSIGRIGLARKVDDQTTQVHPSRIIMIHPEED